MVNKVAYDLQQVHLGLHETLMDCDLKIAVKHLDQLINVESVISVGDVHEGSMLSLSLTALSC